MNFAILHYDTIASTNTEALEQARQGAAEGLCVVARQQTAGRGRHGRTWVSEKDAGLYFSIVLRPKLEMQFLPLITLMTGVAVHDTLAAFGVEPDIKWVNDILVSDKKICGILAETTETPKGLAVIVGIGINLRSSNFPPEIGYTATSIEESTGTLVDTNGLVEDLTKNISQFYEVLQTDSGPSAIISEWKKRSSYFSGKAVRVNLENETITGVTDGIEYNGALRVLKDDGELIVVQAGDVQRLRSQ